LSYSCYFLSIDVPLEYFPGERFVSDYSLAKTYVSFDKKHRTF